MSSSTAQVHNSHPSPSSQRAQEQEEAAQLTKLLGDPSLTVNQKLTIAESLKALREYQLSQVDERRNSIVGSSPSAPATVTAPAKEVVPSHNPVSQFWTALIHDIDCVTEVNGKLIINRREVRWGWDNDVYELYVRQCYEEAVAELMSLGDNSMAIVVGSPGIGKTLFIFYFIYRQVKRAMESSQPIPTFVLGDRSGKQLFLCVDANGNATAMSVTTMPPQIPDYWITDTYGYSSPTYEIQCIHVTSVNNKNMEDIDKLFTQKRKRRQFIFPVFSYDEYVECDCNGSFNEADKNFFYDVFGGSLRNLRCAADDDAIQPIAAFKRLVQSQMTSFFGGFELSSVPEETWNRAVDVVSHLLKSPSQSYGGDNITPDVIRQSLLLHYMPDLETPKSWSYLPATKFMRHLIGCIHDEKRKDALTKLKWLTGSSGAGYFHEHEAHDFRLENLKKGGIQIWSLDSDNDDDPVVLKKEIKRIVRIRRTGDVGRLLEGDYGLPTIPNYPFLDAILDGNVFQDTIAKRHGSVAKLEEIIKAMKKWGKKRANDMRLIFSLGEDDFDTFKPPTDELIDKFSLWKTRPEHHVDAPQRRATGGTAGRKPNAGGAQARRNKTSAAGNARKKTK